MEDTNVLKFREGERPKESGLPGRTADLVGLSQDWITQKDPITGNFIRVKAQKQLGTMPLRFSVQGLKAYLRGALIDWEYKDVLPIDEAEARDAQCRAGWPDVGYGFYGFHSEAQPDGRYLATWTCGVSCE